MKSFHDAVAKLRDWLERNFDAVGLCAIDSEDSRYYYKTPYLMTMAGMRSRGGRVARQILEKFVAEDGELEVGGSSWPTGSTPWDGSPSERYRGGAIRSGPPDGRPPRTPIRTAAAAASFSRTRTPARRWRRSASRVAPAWPWRRSDACTPPASCATPSGTLIDEQESAPCFYNRFRRDGSVLARKAGGDWEMAYDLGEEEQRPANFATVVNALVWAGRGLRQPDYFAVARRYVDLVYRHRSQSRPFRQIDQVRLVHAESLRGDRRPGPTGARSASLERFSPPAKAMTASGIRSQATWRMDRPGRGSPILPIAP